MAKTVTFWSGLRQTETVHTGREPRNNFKRQYANTGSTISDSGEIGLVSLAGDIQAEQRPAGELAILRQSLWFSFDNGQFP
jgi:hypothetical protein